MPQRPRKDVNLVSSFPVLLDGRKEDLLPAALGASSYRATTGQAGGRRQVTATVKAGKRLKCGTVSAFSARHIQAGKMEAHQTKPHTSPTQTAFAQVLMILNYWILTQSLNSHLTF